MIGVEVVWIATRVVLFEEVLSLRLGWEVRAVPIAEGGRGLRSKGKCTGGDHHSQAKTM